MTDLREMGKLAPPPKIIDCLKLIELHKQIETRINTHSIRSDLAGEWIRVEDILEIIEEEFGKLDHI